MLGTDEEPGRGPTPAPFVLFMTSDPCPITTSTMCSAVTCHCQCVHEGPGARGSQLQSCQCLPRSRVDSSENLLLWGAQHFSAEGEGARIFLSDLSSEQCWRMLGCLRGKARTFSFLLQTAG